MESELKQLQTAKDLQDEYNGCQTNFRPNYHVQALIERIDHAETKLAASDWQPITAENLPKVGDMLWQSGEDSCVERPEGYICIVENGLIGMDFRKLTKGGGWTHFRPINAPSLPAGEGTGKAR